MDSKTSLNIGESMESNVKLSTGFKGRNQSVHVIEKKFFFL